MNHIPEIHEVEIMSLKLKYIRFLKNNEDTVKVKKIPGLTVSKNRNFLSLYLIKINIGFKISLM
jgi:hypothetical protein